MMGQVVEVAGLLIRDRLDDVDRLTDGLGGVGALPVRAKASAWCARSSAQTWRNT